MQSLSNKQNFVLLDDERFHKKKYSHNGYTLQIYKICLFLRNIWIFFIGLEKIADEIHNLDSDFDN